MSFKYVICIDFEATCWSIPRKEDAEIIGNETIYNFFNENDNFFSPTFQEIGAILLNLTTGDTEDQFHRHVRPTLFPKLSAYCTNLTGITQNLIDRQQPFAKFYDEFMQWLDRIKSEKSVLFATPSLRRAADDKPSITFCSWSSFDLNFFFKKELQRARINVPSCFKTWIDARRIFNVRFVIFIFAV